jgi:hypothetical protein
MRLSLRTYFLLTSIVVLQFVLLVDIATSLPMINNGDYYRVTRGLINLPPWSAVGVCPETVYKLTTPASSLGIVVETIAWLTEKLGQSCFNLKVYSITLYTIHLFGCFFAILADKKNVFTIFITSVIAIAYSSFFISFYEETIVIVAIPWLVAGISLIQGNRNSICFLLATCCITFAKVQMVILLPFFFYLLIINYRRKRIHTSVLIVGFVFLLCSTAASFLAKSENNIPNAYNRLYNGIGWSVLNLDAWGKDEFNERHNYYYANRAELLSNVQSNFLPHKLLAYLGTSYWPTGLEIFSDEVNLIETKEQIKNTLTPGFYLKTLFINSIFCELIVTTYKVALNSNYSINYLLQNSERHRKSIQLKKPLQKYFGLVFLTLALIGLIRHGWAGKVGSLTILLMPLFVVVGDGFYEFEKHMVPFIMMLPIVFVPSYLSCKNKLGYPSNSQKVWSTKMGR